MRQAIFYDIFKYFCHKMRMMFLRFSGCAFKKVKHEVHEGISFKNLHAFCVKVFALLLLTSCSAIDSFLALPTPIPPTETPIPTATIVWFPPSVTPSPQYLLTREPTPEMRPNVGKVILSDDFSDDSLWDPATFDLGGASINKNRLNLATHSGGYLMSLRHNTLLSDFYAEITAAPNLCSGENSYGLLVRANAVAYYRFGLSCSGTVGVERVSGRSRALLQEPVQSGDVPLGTGEVRIGVWAVGAEIRLFLNGRYQFSVDKVIYPSGGIGVFVNSARDMPVVVSFSDLSVREVK
jgi:hypothetical protein